MVRFPFAPLLCAMLASIPLLVLSATGALLILPDEKQALDMAIAFSGESSPADQPDADLAEL